MTQRPSMPNPRLSYVHSQYRPTSPRSCRTARSPFYIVRRAGSVDTFTSANEGEDANETAHEARLRARVTSFDVGNWTYVESRPTLPEILSSTEHNDLSRVHSEPTAGPMIRQFQEERLPQAAHVPLQNMADDVAKAVRKVVEAEYRKRVEASKGRGREFWMTFAAVFVTAFLSAVDLTIISPILPTIAQEMPRSSISPLWITSGFLATSASFQPLFGGLSDAIGRRESLMLATIIFLLGSVVACLARNMLMIVVGRGIQGLGGGGMTVVGQVIMSDVTTLAERGHFLGLTSIAFALAALAAPVAGGWFATFDWRISFYINFPIGVVAIALIVPLKLNKPTLSLKEKVQRMDIIGSLLLFVSVTALLFGLTNGGVIAPWSSSRILVPLACGTAGMILFLLVEFIPTSLTRHPLLPAKLFRHPTAAIAYALTFLHGMLLYGATQGLVLFFENRGDSPLRAAINILPANTPSTPAAFLAGFLMAVTGRYKTLIIVCEGLMTLGLGLFIGLGFDASALQWASFQVIASIGLGALYALTLPPVQATLPAAELAHATATYAFARSFGAVWGVSIFLIAFQIHTGKDLAKIPEAAEFGLTGATAIDFVPAIAQLPPEFRAPINEIFHRAFQFGLKIMTPISGLGFVLALFLKHVPLPNYNDSKYGIEGRTAHGATFRTDPARPTPVAPVDAADVERLYESTQAESQSDVERCSPTSSLRHSTRSKALASDVSLTDHVLHAGCSEGHQPQRGLYSSPSMTGLSTATTSSWANTLTSLRKWMLQLTFDTPWPRRRASRLTHTIPRPAVDPVLETTESGSAAILHFQASLADEAHAMTPVQSSVAVSSWRESMSELHRRTIEVERRYEAIYANLTPSSSLAQ